MQVVQPVPHSVPLGRFEVTQVPLPLQAEVVHSDQPQEVPEALGA